LIVSPISSSRSIFVGSSTLEAAQANFPQIQPSFSISPMSRVGTQIPTS
jgi:hypothetical protein